MPSLIVSGDTISVRLVSKHLEVIRWIQLGKKSESRMRVPLVDVDRVVLIGRPSISFPVIYRLLRDGVPCYLLTAGGRWVGCITPDNNKNAARRIRQYELASDESFALGIARKFVTAKIRNSRRVLQRLSANRDKSHLDVQRQVDAELRELSRRAETAESLDELRGFEGLAAAKYFARLAGFFPPNVPFGGRSRRPPKDAANALMSWTYAILLGEVDGAVRQQGLDACLGFLHGLKHGSPSLALDLLEPLRAPVADLLVLNLLNHRILTETDFEFNPEQGGFWLKQEAHKTFFVAYEAAMTRQFMRSKGGPHTDFRGVIKEDVMQVIRSMDGTSDGDFFVMP